MGCPLTEWTIETVLRDGLNELRLNPVAFDDLFSKFTMTFFNNQYGSDKIAELKTYIQNNQVKIVHALHVQPTDMPCISIQLLGADEAEDDQQLSNMLPEFVAPKAPNVIVPNFVPVAYNATTGRLTVPNDVNLANVCPGLVFMDAEGNAFPIGSGNSNLAGDKYINIGPDKVVDISGNSQIVSPIDFSVTDRRMIRLRETINLGCHAADKVHLAKFLYYIVYFIIKSRQEVMEQRGIHLDRGISSVFDREGEYEGEHIYSRYIQLQALTEFTWDQEQVNLVDCFDVTIHGEEVEKFTINQSESQHDQDEEDGE